MEIWPAIDLRGGQCVRLIQGQYDKQITYGQDPARQALAFEQAGARHLHVVDLDGAKSGQTENLEAIQAIREAVKMQIEVGGGIRDEESICMMLNLGVDRVILGTSAIREFGWFGQMAVRYPGKLVLGLDARGAQAAEQGWTQESGHSVLDLAMRAAKFPIAAIVYTDITKDGMMTGPNFDRTGDLAAAVTIPVIASGGVTTVEDIRKLVPLGVAGAIIGRALYEGKIQLADIIVEQIMTDYIQTVFGGSNYIFRPAMMFGHGVDAEVEFKDNDGKASGKKIFLLLKRGNSFLQTRRSDGRKVFNVNDFPHLKYWINQPEDIYLVIVQADEKGNGTAIHWMNITPYLKHHNVQTSHQIIFEGEQMDMQAVKKVRDEFFMSS